MATNRSIKKIEVRQLFGYYNYIVDQSENDISANPLLIIYGDNGSGKTTLLKMLFYLLSPIDKSGHKTKLSEIKFNSFKITLNDDTEVSAIRDPDFVSGSFTLRLKQHGNLFDVYLEVNSNGDINLPDGSEADRKYLEFLQKIRELKIAINFLSDDRKTLSFLEEKENSVRKRQKIFHSASSIDLDFQDILERQSEDSVDISIKKLEGWLKSNALKGSKAGEENTNTIYSKLVKQISTPILNVKKSQVKSLIEKINKIRAQSLDFYKSGLISEIEIEDFESALQTANENNIVLIYNILEPYINGIQGRLNSLSYVQDILSKFLDSINNYFSNKTISYNIDIGFKLIHNELNESIGFNTLSSGEKQLLHLFSNVITSSEQSTIFIIDEPEISLNVKWQRKLINTLLSFAKNKNVQFIFASHSIELLSGHRKSVFKLENVA